MEDIAIPLLDATAAKKAEMAAKSITKPIYLVTVKDPINKPLFKVLLSQKVDRNSQIGVEITGFYCTPKQLEKITIESAVEILKNGKQIQVFYPWSRVIKIEKIGLNQN